MPSHRSAREVLEDHLHRAVAGDIETDLAGNYAPDVVILTGFGVFHGHEGLRETNRRLQHQLPQATYRYRTQLDAGEIAFLEWSATSEAERVDDGVDTYHIRDGRIRVQTLHYTLTPHREEHTMATDQQLMDRCIQECLEVVRTANQCAAACLRGGQATEMAECIRLCLDATTTTGACAELMARDSSISGQICAVCADICDACAAECEQHDGDIMRQCAEACRACTRTCRQMAA